MKRGSASRTAEYMALFRALESVRPRSRQLFYDPLAIHFIAPRYRLAVGLARVPPMGAFLRAFIDWRWPGARTSGVARTRFIDDIAVEALGSGIEQVVILGAGYDARAYRLPSMAQSVVFEVDHPDTSAAKQRLVQASLGVLPTHVRFVAIDFLFEPLPAKMDAAGFSSSRPTLFIWEGVTNYLSAAAVDVTLRWCAGAAPSSTVVFTYIDRKVLDHPESFGDTRELLARLRAAGEQWTFGLEPSGLASYLRERGLLLKNDVGATDYRARCFGLSSIRMRGYEFYRIATAQVQQD